MLSANDITAIATAITAAAGSMLLAWEIFTYYAIPWPHVEWEFRRDQQGRPFLSAHARNHSTRTFRVLDARLVRPRGAMILRASDETTSGSREPVKPASQVTFNGLLSVAGSKSGLGVPMASDWQRLDLIVFPPAGWESGRVTIDIRIAQRRGRNRTRRFRLSDRV